LRVRVVVRMLSRWRHRSCSTPFTSTCCSDAHPYCTIPHTLRAAARWRGAVAGCAPLCSCSSCCKMVGRCGCLHCTAHPSAAAAGVGKVVGRCDAPGPALRCRETRCSGRDGGAVAACTVSHCTPLCSCCKGVERCGRLHCTVLHCTAYPTAAIAVMTGHTDRLQLAVLGSSKREPRLHNGSRKCSTLGRAVLSFGEGAGCDRGGCICASCLHPWDLARMPPIQQLCGAACGCISMMHMHSCCWQSSGCGLCA
jgi:hypothetical protein